MRFLPLDNKQQGQRIRLKVLAVAAGMRLRCEKVSKGARRMPWLSEAKKDVISCDKRRVGASDL